MVSGVVHRCSRRTQSPRTRLGTSRLGKLLGRLPRCSRRMVIGSVCARRAPFLADRHLSRARYVLSRLGKARCHLHLKEKALEGSGEGGGGAVELYWLPLGAGGHSVRLNGRIFEWCAARLQRRDRCDLYHSALEVRVPEGRFVIEQAPAWSGSGERGVVAEGAVGTRVAGRLRLFRYEIRRWRDGLIPDVSEAVESPQHLSDDIDRARCVLKLVPAVPTRFGVATSWAPRDVELQLARLVADRAKRPRRRCDPSPSARRAPGWHAGIVLARRQQMSYGW